MRCGELTPNGGYLTRLLLDIVFQLVFAQLDVFEGVVGHNSIGLWFCEELVEQNVSEKADERALDPRLAAKKYDKE